MDYRLPLKQHGAGNGFRHASPDTIHISGIGRPFTNVSAGVAPGVKKPSGPLPLSFFGEEDDSDFSNGSVAASCESVGAVKPSGNGEQKASEAPVDHGTELNSRQDADPDEELDFGDFESVPAQKIKASSPAHMGSVDSSTLILNMHGHGVSAALNRQFPPLLFDQASVQSETLQRLPEANACLEPPSNGANQEVAATLEQVNEVMSDDEWGDFVAPAVPPGGGGLFEPSASRRITSNGVNDGPLSPQIASSSEEFSSSKKVTPSQTVSVSFTSNGGDMPRMILISDGPDYSFSFPELQISGSDAKLASNHLRSQQSSGQQLFVNYFEVESGAMGLTTLDISGDSSKLREPLPPAETRQALKSDVLLDFGKGVEGQISERDAALSNLELEDDETWDWVEAEATLPLSCGGSKLSSEKILTREDGFDGSAPVASEVAVAVDDQVLISSSEWPEPEVANSHTMDADRGMSADETELRADHLNKSLPVTSTAPLPLSLFGEDEVDDTLVLELEAKPVTNGIEDTRKCTHRTNSLNLASSKFSDLIASLYPDAPTTENAGLKKASHHRSRSATISNSKDVDFFFSKADSDPLRSHVDKESSVSAAETLITYTGMLDNDLVAQDQMVDGFSIPSPGDADSLHSDDSNVLEDILYKMDLRTILEESVNIERSYFGGFNFQFAKDDRVGIDESIRVNDRGNETVDALGKLVLELINEGRVLEADHCSKHMSAVSCLPALQDAYSSAFDSGEYEKAASAAKEIEMAQKNLVKQDEMLRWQSRRRRVEMLVSSSVHHSVYEQAGSCGLSSLTLDEMLELLGDDARARVLKSLFDADEIITLARRDLEAALKLHTHAVHTFRVLACATAEVQQLCVGAWSRLATVCVNELEHASNILQRALDCEAHTPLLNTPKGRNFFAAVGQIYVVCCVIAVALKLYEPWLAVAKEQGQAATKTVERCCKVWSETKLQKMVRSSLMSNIHSLPMTVVSWADIQKLPSAARTAMIEAAGRSSLDSSPHHLCGLSLLPLLPFTAISAMEWEGQHYLLPLANLWANRVSREAPALPSPKVGYLQA